MLHVSDLPPDLQARLGGRDLIVFDGVCVLCSGFFRFVLRHDRAGRFAFVTAQSQLGTALYAALGLPTTEYETNLVIVEGRIHRHAGAFAAAMGALGWPWRLAAPIGLMPRWLTTPAYLLIARNRYRLFGRHDSCMVPPPDLRARFLAGGWS
ncbi:thiol-disulfide oxidoreductase DCC family protein [Mesobacterium pallidum]|uniref:thiol-disulfide oxidoreductase DCC family protein n=1 Tax=Mesobacterium pallidum TaxID=2872037 RepID=UPI001EE25098|nr:DCC1-like thiol-disulfide oxidoreductase family protein [Mesobacterium pallidum]